MSRDIFIPNRIDSGCAAVDENIIYKVFSSYYDNRITAMEWNTWEETEVILFFELIILFIILFSKRLFCPPAKRTSNSCVADARLLRICKLDS